VPFIVISLGQTVSDKIKQLIKYTLNGGCNNAEQFFESDNTNNDHKE
jgi:hypothetical protein